MMSSATAKPPIESTTKIGDTVPDPALTGAATTVVVGALPSGGTNVLDVVVSRLAVVVVAARLVDVVDASGAVVVVSSTVVDVEVGSS